VNFWLKDGVTAGGKPCEVPEEERGESHAQQFLVSSLSQFSKH